MHGVVLLLNSEVSADRDDLAYGLDSLGIRPEMVRGSLDELRHALIQSEALLVLGDADPITERARVIAEELGKEVLHLSVTEANLLHELAGATPGPGEGPLSEILNRYKAVVAETTTQDDPVPALPPVPHDHPDQTLMVDRLEGFVFSVPQPGAVQLSQIVDDTGKDHQLVVHDPDGSVSIPAGWQKVEAFEAWVYPADANNDLDADSRPPGGMVPLWSLHDTTRRNHIHTSDPIERRSLQLHQLNDDGLLCRILSTKASGENLLPLLRLTHRGDDNTFHCVHPEKLEELITDASSQEADVAAEDWQVEGVRLDSLFGGLFGSVGEHLGSMLELLDFRVDKADVTTSTVEPTWAKQLSEQSKLPSAVLAKFSKQAKVFTFDASIQNLIDRNDRISVKTELKLFHLGVVPQFQLKLTLSGTHTVDRYLPPEWTGTDSMPIVGHAGITDPTLIFATTGSIYDAGLDAPINVGLNAYANLNLVADDPAKQDPWLDLISRAVGVKNAAVHLALGLPLSPSSMDVYVLAELALQWRQYNVAPAATALATGDTERASTVAPDGMAVPCIKTEQFSLSMSRSDFWFRGTLLPEPSITLGLSTDIALELDGWSVIGLEPAKLVFTGGFEADFSADGSISPTLMLTMNGTGRNTTGKLTGTEVNTTSLKLEPVPGFDLVLRQLALEVGLKIEEELVVTEKLGFVVDAKAETLDGRVAAKVDVTDPTDFVLATSLKHLSLRQLLRLGSLVGGGFSPASMMTWASDLAVGADNLEAFDNAVGIFGRDLQLYVVPKPTSIAGVHFAHDGLVASGTLDLWGWQATMTFVAAEGKGVAFAARADPFDLTVAGRNIIRIDAAEPRTDTELAWLTDHLEATQTQGPRLTCALFSGSAGDVKAPQVVVEGSVHLTILGHRTAALDLAGTNSRWNLTAALDVGVMSGVLDLDFWVAEPTSGLPQLDATFVLNASLGIGQLPTPLGSIDFGRVALHFDQRMHAGSDNFLWHVDGHMEVPVAGRISVNLQFMVVPADLAHLGEQIYDELKDLVLGVFSDVGEWAEAAAEKLFDDVGNAVNVMASEFAADAKAMEAALVDGFEWSAKLARQAIATAGRAIDWTVHETVEAAHAIGGFFSRTFGHHDPTPEDLREFAEECAADPNRYWALVEWGEMSSLDQQSWSTLGWNWDNWTVAGNTPSSMTKRWGDLSHEEQAAAKRLAFHENTWNFGHDNPYRAFRAQRQSEPMLYWQNFSFSQFSDKDRRRWESLGWDAAAWDSNNDDENAPLSYFQDWQSLSAVQQQAARFLGITQLSWDPADNARPGGYWNQRSWSQMPSDAQSNWSVLGWSQDSWDNEGNSSTGDLDFAELSKPQQEAARALGYSEHTWNDDE